MNRRRAFVAAGIGGAVLTGALMWLFTPALSQSQSVARSCRDPSILIDKSDAVLELHCGGELRGSYLATFGAHPTGPKMEEGDERTPEGDYAITSRRSTERFHRFLGISYPNAADRVRSRSAGITRLGGAIGIHGVNASRAALGRAWIRGSHALGLATQWGPTDGCIALTNEDVEVVYDAVRVGTRVRIRP